MLGIYLHLVLLICMRRGWGLVPGWDPADNHRAQLSQSLQVRLFSENSGVGKKNAPHLLCGLKNNKLRTAVLVVAVNLETTCRVDTGSYFFVSKSQ